MIFRIQLFTLSKSILAAKGNDIFQISTIFSEGGSLRQQVASLFDIQRINYDHNFAA